MEFTVDLPKGKMEQVYEAVLRDWCEDEINTRLYENEYCKEQGIDEFSEDEVKLATDLMHEQMLYDIRERLDWLAEALYAIDDVVSRRPLKEEPKPITQFAKTLAMYGLKVNDVFQVVNVQGYEKTLYMFDESGCLCYYNFASKTFQWCANDLANFLIRVSPENIVHTSLEAILQSKEKGKDLLNATLKMIGLETNQFFRINDNEFGGDDFYIDSFGDEYLTLGRILTQYPDKIVPWDIDEVGYA